MSTDLNKQQEFVLRTLEERNIRFVRLWFTDVLGFLKSVAIAPAELENAFDEGIGFDGSAIEGGAQNHQVLHACSATSQCQMDQLHHLIPAMYCDEH